MRNHSNPGCISRVSCLLSGLLLFVVITPPVMAHLMVAQRGTLNIVGDGVYMVLSLPVSAFDAIDDDGDDKMSAAEFTKHRTSIITAVNKQVTLADAQGELPLEGLLLSPVASHDEPTAPVEQLVVMGKFVLRGVISEELSRELTFRAGLFGLSEGERELIVTAKYPEVGAKREMVLTPEQPDSWVFPAVEN